MSREAVFVIGEGTVTALAGGPLSLAPLGARSTERVSHLEFNSASQVWEVFDVQDTARADALFESPDYDTALRWEVDHYNRLLAA